MAAEQTNNREPSVPQPARRFTQRLETVLRGDRPADGVRLFVDGVAHDLIADRPDLAQWLRKTVGRAETQRLVKAFALEKCFYCKGGLERCASCGGRGYFADQTICEACIGLGVAPCDFCTGSGWVTYNYVPAGLRLPVILARVKTAVAQAKSLLRAPASAGGEPDPRAAGKTLAKELVQLNRLTGVFENAIVAGEKLAAGDATLQPGVRKLEHTCVQAARKLQTRARRVLRELADAARLQSTRAARPATRAVAARRAQFYDNLASSDNFLGSGLQHPRLQQTRSPGATPPPAPEPPPEPPG